MSNLGNFSPSKRSYQFIHIQNSAYHLRNKQQAKPMVKTNIKPAQRSRSSFKQSHSRSEMKSSDRYSCANSQLLAQPQKESYTYKEPHRVIHKNQSYERVKSARIDTQNKKLINKLIDGDCSVLTRSQAAQNYKKQRKYFNLIRKYQQNGERHITPIVNVNKLSPAIAGYHSNRSSRAQSAQQRAKLDDFDPENYYPVNWLG